MSTDFVLGKQSAVAWTTQRERIYTCLPLASDSRSMLNYALAAYNREQICTQVLCELSGLSNYVKGPGLVFISGICLLSKTYSKREVAR